MKNPTTKLARVVVHVVDYGKVELGTPQSKLLIGAKEDFDNLLDAADALLNGLYVEYPEKLPFYFRDRAQVLLSAIDKAKQI